MDCTFNHLNGHNRTLSHSLFDRASFYYNNCTSTNDIAQQYILKHRVAEGTIFIADYQYKGKGQRGSNWTAEPAQNLLFSIILYPKLLPIDNSFSLNVMVSLAIYEAISHQLPEGVSIKWPNDIYHLDKKLSGILIETSIGPIDKIKTAIIGIGVNVNQLSFPWPNSTSLALSKGAMIDRAPLFTHIIDTLGTYYAQFQNGIIDILWEKYMNKLYRKTGFHTFETINGRFQGRILEINRLGQLVVEGYNGKKYSYNSKEIIFR